MVEEVAKSLDKTTAEIDQIEAAGWLILGSYDPPPMDGFLEALHSAGGGKNVHPAHRLGPILTLRASGVQ